jgi:hypothetical protein
MEGENMDRIETLSKIGASLIGVQIEAARIGPADLARDPYVFGYCFGLFETMAQIAGLEQYSEGAAAIEAAFAKVVDDADAGPRLFRLALEMKIDADFVAGAEEGDREFAAWVDDANAVPTGIARHTQGRA